MNGVEIAIALAKPCVVLAMTIALMSLTIWMERKGSAYIQDRRGPNRARIAGVTLWGLLHIAADTIKLFMKEEVLPARAIRSLAILAPMIAFATATVAVAVVPFTGSVEIGGYALSLQVADLGSGLVFAIAMTSLGVYAVILAGWASGNTYSFIGSIRSSAQFISYELALGLAAAAVFVVAGSLDLNDIVAGQSGPIWMWNAVRQPVAFFIFVTAIFAEAHRLPFDLPEGESEIVGFHVEYSSMRFAMFFMAEYVHVVVGSAIIAAVFLGGWGIPFLSLDGLNPVLILVVQLAVMLAKTIFMCAVFIWVRWTLPRFRYDRLMSFGWRFLLPLAMLNAAVTAFAVLRIKG